MKIKNLVGLFVLAIALLFVPTVSAAFPANVEYVELNGFNILESNVIGVEAGENLDFTIVFDTNGFPASLSVRDARVTARVLGEPGVYATSERFDLLPGNVYTRELSLTLPNDIDLEPNEGLTLEITIESRSDGIGDVWTATLAAQRKNYALEFLSIESPSRISTGEFLPIEIVVENRGRHTAEDTFVIASIPALDISKKIFLEDLAASESVNNEVEDDAIEGRVLLAIPAGTTPGLYTVEVKAFSKDSETVATRKVEILSGNLNSAIVSSPSSRTFSAGSDGKYTLTIVNSGNRILVYNLVAESDNGLTVDFDDSVVVVPAGSSKAIEMIASASREGNYNFKVTVLDSDNNVVGEKNFVANVEGKTVGGNAAVVLTIILAIVFVVLLVVLIVLLTRKPAKADESGESYY